MTTEHGLIANRVTSIGQDNDGFLWFGTPQGLQRFDGYELKTYHKTSHFPKSPIFEDDNGSLWMICEGGEVYRLNIATEKFKKYPKVGKLTYDLIIDSKGNIWAATFGNGLAKYVPEADTFLIFKNNPSDTNSIKSDTVYKIFEDSKNHLWIGTAKGLNLYHNSEKIFKRFPNTSNEAVFSIDEDINGIIWLGTNNGLNKFNPLSGDFVKYELPKVDRIDNIFVDSKNRIWLTSNFGIQFFDEENHVFVKFKNFNKYIMNGRSWSNHPILESKDGSIWSVVFLRLSKFEPNKNDFFIFHNDPLNSYSINDDTFSEILEDKTGNLWFGTHSGGVNYIITSKKQFEFYPKKLLTTIYVDKNNNLWVGTQNGLFKTEIKNENRKYKKIEGINNFITQITEDSLGNLWITANKNLVKFNPRSNKITNYSINQFLSRILYNSKGDLLIGTGTGNFYVFDPENESFSLIYSFGHMIHCLLESNDSTIWIVNGGKLNIFRGDSIKPFNSQNLPHIRRLYEDSMNNMWAVLKNNKLLILNKTKSQFKEFSAIEEHINSEMIDVICESNGSFWMITTKGMSLFNPKTGDIKNFTKDDGISLPLTGESTFPYCLGKNGEIYFGGNDGYVVFHPDSIQENPNPPPIVLTDFKIKNKSVEISDSSYLNKNINDIELVELPYHENIFSIEFAALDYSAPIKNKYAYKLEGFNEDWVYTDAENRVASYTNLDPGNFVFRVIGSNSDGVWNETGASVKIIILPPWYHTWWAYSLYILLLSSILVYFYLQQHKRLKLKHEIEMMNFEAKKITEVDEMKSKFFENISHELRTPLTLIKGPVEQLLNDERVENPKKIYSMINRNSERLLNLINEILDLSKLESGKMKLNAQKSDIVSFVKGIAMSFESSAAVKKIQIQIVSDKEEIELYFDKEKMQKIITNLISNACKFTKERGKISVELEEDLLDKKVDLRVIDNGIGIPEKEIPKIFDRFYQVTNNEHTDTIGTGIGLALTKELVEMHHGYISVESKEGEGSTFKLSFPIGKDHFTEDELIYEENEISEIRLANEEKLNADSTEKGKELIMIVEDNKDVRDFIKSILEINFRVIEAEDGIDGCKKALEFIPDVIISDIMMPKISGDKMTQIIKKGQMTSHIPIILLTAKASNDEKVNGLEIGADDYLIKPFNEKELLARINNLILQRRKLREKYLREAEINPVEVAVSSMDKMFIKNVIEYIDENISNPEFGVNNLINKLAVSRSQLYRKFSSVLGEKPNEFIRKYRIKRAAQLIRKDFGNITQIAQEVGFNDLAYFSKCFKNIYHLTPHEYAQQEQN